MNNILEHLAELQEQLHSKGIAGLIVPSNDPHFSEYVADRWKVRKWLSGFTGSAGTVVIAKGAVALWTDSRYFLQAEQQLKDTSIILKKMKVAGVESVEEWLKQQLSVADKVAVDKDLFSVAEFNRLRKELYPLELLPIDDVFDKVWDDRPALPSSKAMLLDAATVGESTHSKLARVRQSLAYDGSFVYPILMLDEIAWLFNLRGADIAYNPLALAYAAVTSDRAYLFIDQHKLTAAEKESLDKEGVTIAAYENFAQTIKQLSVDACCIYNSRKITIGLYMLLANAGCKLQEEGDSNGAVCSLKSVKNSIEQQGFRTSMLHDGVALVRFQHWLERQVGVTKVTELSATDKLAQLRRMSNDFVGESFASIMAYRAHGAIVHYSATHESDAEIKPEGFLLFDTGGQYLYGTTDVTRTIHLGTPTPQEKQDYTLVLKGMIALSMAKFPSGTRGAQLDVLARQPLWAHGENFFHGTGHGVGHFLNVHEGPQSIRMEDNPVTLKAGMVTSNEPAVYIEGKYGIRIENLILCQQDKVTDFGEFMQFETLTLAPIDTKPIEKSLLTGDEITWFNTYHQRVFSTLSSALSSEEQAWLKEKTKAI